MKFFTFSLAMLAVTSLAPPVAAQDTTISVGFGPVMDTPYGKGHAEWKRLLEENSGGQMTLELFPSDQLGSGRQVIDQMLLGEPICYSTDASFFAELGVPDMSIVQAPFLFRNWEEADLLFASDWWAGLEDQLAENGVKIIANNWRYGARQTLTTRKVEHPEDFSGMKIRAPQSTIYVKTFEHLGASPTPMALGEVYTSLQQGVIDGLENPLSVIWGGKYHETAKYLLLDNHMRTVNLMACSTTLWDSLPPEQQNVLAETARDAGNFQNELMTKTDAELLEKLKAEGVTVTEAEHDEFSRAAVSFFEDPAFSGWSPDLHKKVLGLIGRD
ncbi:C4-dicarboxylate TRAP transporter substrate-binding protein [Paracoccus saliphilus]|uniref:C4-dicarboxylate TRAP transporter substrate-binding protein n=1 Tax=Paracoccus saliphilus TaxID=405559 RepID=A0AA45W2P8_9RHOB|nr:C4-dicarboxylate TRAP transporter substrate-binding protein [Paracoccus saliphilus]WCR01414.1 C4-dicarboxylate TRAP transporter substrate-binding protein [Paracoccus saliphilus]SIS69795.1 tripartite ATP-independent transporter solute receptor, DctP family [Paracoccus saliphilus]